MKIETVTPAPLANIDGRHEPGREDRGMPRRSTELAQEFVVILIGVFLALAAESWWSEREDRRLEREIREDMIAEFETNIRILEADLATNEESRLRMATVDGLSDEALMALTEDRILGMFYPSVDWAGFDPEMGTVQALVESGNIVLVSDRALRLRLARWAGLLEQNRRFNLQAVTFQQREVMPAFATAGADGQWSASERRELQILMSHMLALFDSTVTNQRQLLETAQHILVFLREND